MANWLELAERCEGVEAPDRDVDAAISARFCLPAPRWKYISPTWEAHEDRPGRVDIWAVGQRVQSGIAARYTASLDAIVALIEERLPGRSWGTGKPGRRGKAARGTIAKAPGERGVSTYHHGNAATPALALCAAFCRAMAERESANAKA